MLAFAIGMLALLALMPVDAQTGAYSVEVAISNRADDQKQEAFTLAMRQVLLANSGDKTLLNRNDVRAGVRDAESFVEQFRYRVPEPGTVIDRKTPVTDLVRQSGEATQLMLVRFDRELITALIEGEKDDAADNEERELAEVAAEAPTSALVWVLIEDGPRDILVTGDNVINVQRRAIEIAGAAGFSLRFPVGDELDSQVLGVEELRILPALNADGRGASGFGKPDGARRARGVDALAGSGADLGTDAGADGSTELDIADAAPARGSVTDNGEARKPLTPLQRLQRASERYAEPMILIGHIQRQPLRGWNSAWQRIDIKGDRQSNTRFTSESLDDALQAGLGWLIPALDGNRQRTEDDRFANERSGTEALIWVSSLDTTESYARTLKFLGRVEGVTTVYPKLASADGMIFSLSPRNALSNLNSALPGVNWLRPVAKPRVAARSRLGRNTELALDFIGPAGD